MDARAFLGTQEVSLDMPPGLAPPAGHLHVGHGKFAIGAPKARRGPGRIPMLDMEIRRPSGSGAGKGGLDSHVGHGRFVVGAAGMGREPGRAPMLDMEKLFVEWPKRGGARPRSHAGHGKSGA